MANEFLVQIAPEFEQLYPDASPLATECAMNLVETADLLVKRISDLLQPFELSPASGLVLSIVTDSETPLPPNKIAERLIISRATVTGLIDSLEKRGYVRRVPHQSDRRMLLVVPTERGKEVAQAFRPVVHHHEKLWLEALNGEEQQQLIGLLHRLQTVLVQAEE